MSEFKVEGDYESSVVCFRFRRLILLLNQIKGAQLYVEFDILFNHFVIKCMSLRTNSGVLMTKDIENVNGKSTIIKQIDAGVCEVLLHTPVHNTYCDASQCIYSMD